MNTLAVVLQAPRDLAMRRLALNEAGDADVVVEVEWSGISSGTERLLWSGRMPRTSRAWATRWCRATNRSTRGAGGPVGGRREGERVFVPGANCFGDVRGLFGGAAATLVLPGSRTVPIDESLGEESVLLALAATAHHAIGGGPGTPRRS